MEVFRCTPKANICPITIANGTISLPSRQVEQQKQRQVLGPLPRPRKKSASPITHLRRHEKRSRKREDSSSTTLTIVFYPIAPRIMSHSKCHQACDMDPPYWRMVIIVHKPSSPPKRRRRNLVCDAEPRVFDTSCSHPPRRRRISMFSVVFVTCVTFVSSR